MPDGTVLVAGGSSSSANSAELYHPDTKTWEAVASMSGERGWHTATLLPDGTVLVAGGGYLSSAELYLP
nr:kelch repeat-containing protein [Burkholderia dolosa]